LLYVLEHAVKEMIRMSGKIISIIFALVMLCVTAGAIQVTSKVATVNQGDTSMTSQSTSEATVNQGVVSMTSESTSETTVNQGDVYTISLGENPSIGYKWKVNPSGGLKLLSDTLGSDGKRELKFLAAHKGKQTVEADYSKSGEEKPAHTSKFVLDVL
jgi:inhibitor of cysteine peptidase